jgi:hypothetical protein
MFFTSVLSETDIELNIITSLTLQYLQLAMAGKAHVAYEDGDV